MRIKVVAALAAAITLATGCTTPVGDYSDKTARRSQELAEWKRMMSEPREERVRITDMPSVGARIELEKHRWLKSKQITVSMSKSGDGVTARSLAQMLKDKGIQVMSSLPLDGYQYTGFGVQNVDGETALRLLFAPMGLDYDINDEGQYVVITPNRSKTFYIKLGERKTKYASGTMTGNVGSGEGGSSSSGSSSGSGSGGLGGSAGGTTLGVNTGLDTGTGEVSIDGDFWANLDNELKALLTQCIPVAVARPVASTTSLPPLPPEMGGPAGGAAFFQQAMVQPPAAAPTANNELCKEQALGIYAINPSTGAVTVQAPHWVLDSVAKYLGTVKADNAVTMVYEGMLISVTSSREKSEGIDLQGFASFASGKLGMVVSNNALGGVTVTPGTGTTPPSVAPGGGTVGNTFLGVQKLTGNPAQAFLAYLEANSEFSVKQKPRVAVTNGVPGEFGQYDTLYYNRISQDASSSSNGGALVGTTNELIPFKVGSLLRIVPYYDSESGFVRSPITFTQSVQTGSYTNTQYITGSDGAAQQVPSEIPLIRDSNYAGEVLMKDGDMLIIGGQVSESSESSGSGLPGYNTRNNPLSAFMGQKSHSDSVNTYYLALTLRVNK